MLIKYLYRSLFMLMVFSAGLFCVNNVFYINNVSAADQTSDVNYSVTVEPTLSISVSSNSIVLDLNPAVEEFKSKELTVKVGTNNSYGYKLYINADTTNLVKTDDNNAYIENITAETDQDHFPTNYWGYMVNSNVLNHTNYNPFTSGTLISESSTATNEQLSTLTFAAKANLDKPAGSYKLDLEFKALPIVTTYTMQELGNDTELANTICTEDPAIVTDQRDEKLYTIRRINGTCWMIDNLRFTGISTDSSNTMTLDSTTSNVASTYTENNPLTITYGDLTLGNSYDQARIHEGTIAASYTSRGIEEPTVWYNYAAASAGTITGSSNTSAQVYDICPSGWRMPTYSEAQAIGNGTSTYKDEFNPVLGGFWRDGGVLDTGYNYWWTSTVYTQEARYVLNWDGKIIESSRVYRIDGHYIRCVLK